MVMQVMRKGKAASVVKYVFLGILMLAAIGLALSGGSSFSNGVGGNDVAKIGGQNIPLAAFDRKMRRTIQRIGMTPEQAYQLGYMDQFLSAEIRSILLQQDAQDKGIRVSRDMIAKRVSAMVAPMVQDGQTSQEVLNQILMSQGLTESEFVHQLGSEVASGLLMNALATGTPGNSQTLAKTMYIYENETRDIALVDFPDDSFKLDNTPSEDDLKAVYEAQKRSFVIPEKRTIDIAIIKTDDLEKSVEVTDEELKEIYDKDLEMFTEPERRTVEQAIVQKESDAARIAELAKGGKNLKDAVKEITNTETGYIAPQNFAKDDMTEQVATPVFAATEKDTVIGPVSTPFGQYVVVMKDIVKANTKSFEDVKAELRKEVMANHLQDQKFDRLSAVEDLVAGGATLEEVGQQIPLDIKTIENVTAFSSTDKLKSYGKDADTIIQNAFEYEQGEISSVKEMSETGAQFVVDVKSITPESYKPFEEVKADLEKNWMKMKKREGNQNRAEEFLAKITAGEIDGLGTLAKEQGTSIKTLKSIARNKDVQKPLVQNNVSLIFALEKNAYSVIQTDDGFSIVKITGITLPKEEDIKPEDLKEISKGLTRDSTNELSALYIEKLREEKGASVNQGLLQRIYGASEAAY